jgi:hypothetical protein
VKLFVGYRTAATVERQAGMLNPADQVQYEGVVFRDGTVVVRWLTTFGSHSVWDSFASFSKIHASQPGDRIEWVKAEEGKVIVMDDGDTLSYPRCDPFSMTPGYPF